MKQNAEIAEGD